VYKVSWPSALQLGIDPPGVLGLEVDAALVPEAVRVEFQFRQELGSEISRCNVSATYMTEV
jgi:hypothetical protein